MFPPYFIDYLRNLPSLDNPDLAVESSSANERPAKRRKTDPSDLAAIHVANGDATISRRCIDNSTSDFAITRQDIGHFFRFSQENGRLRMSSRTGSPFGPLSALISLREQDYSDNAKAIIQSAGPNLKQSVPGAIWTTVNLSMQRQGRVAHIKLFFELHWNETPSPYHVLRPNKERASSQELIDAIFPMPNAVGYPAKEASAWSPMDFYEAAFVPPKDDQVANAIEVPGLDSTLFPYQKRTLQWLLRREGVQWSQDSRGVRHLSDATTPSSIGTFRLVKDVSGADFYLSDLFHVITRDPTHFRRAEMAVKGGILAEEMGLGKTLEILGLISLHTRPSPPELTPYEIEAKLVPTGATLIVTPESLRAQWMSEISRHAPGLTVKYYQGCKKLSDVDEERVINELAGCDVVITTYNILSAELHFATVPPERSRRHERAYPRTKSPLVQMSWWRVCLDEAQMIENGFSQAAMVARVIPRINAWGITGTPVKDDVKDLFGLLLFLRYEPYCSASQVWQALIQKHKPIFQQLFKSISLRHTKTLVRDELLLPPQKRYVISMPFTAVEEQHYQSLFQEMTSECNLAKDGAPLVDDWEPEDYEETMRIWLNRLRQTALHPEVAVYNRRVLGHSKSRPMRTVDEVLDAMLEQSENSIRVDERAYLSSKLTRGQLYENSPQVREALEIWQTVRDETEKLVADARTELKALIGQGGSALEEGKDPDESDDEPGDSESKGRLGECRRRLRGALEMQHKAVFFCANAHFQIRDNPEMTEPDSEEFHRIKKLEDEGYENAKVIRREILQESHRKATKLMDRLKHKAQTQSFVEVPELVASPEKGIESSNIVEELEALYGDLNEQADIIDQWREHVIQLLLKPLLDEEDDIETTGEELGESAKVQDEMMVYVTALRAAIADRQDAISGQTNELIKHETETMMRLAKDGDGPAPEKFLELMQIRAHLKPGSEHCSMRGSLSRLRALISKLARDESTGSYRAEMEGKIATKHLKETHAFLTEQNKAALGLESEIESFKTTMNLRLEYYRQLQVVSDSVLPYEGARTAAAIEKLKQTEETLRRKVATAEAKHRYRECLPSFDQFYR